jgi:hypothetical protein
MVEKISVSPVIKAYGEGRQAPEGGNGLQRGDWARCFDDVLSARDLARSVRALVEKLLITGVDNDVITGVVRALLDASVAADSEPMQLALDDLPVVVEEAREAFEAERQRRREAERKAAPSFLDPWDVYVVPPFPFVVLPEHVRDFVETNSRIIGCDPSALAMACLGALSAAVDHRTTLKIMKAGSWRVSPRLWVLFVGEPSRKKSPVFNVALAELIDYQSVQRRHYEEALAAFKKSGDADAEEPVKPPRYVTMNTATEKLEDILAHQERAGMLVHSDEIAGWIGGMEKYSDGNKAAGASRAFWLQAYDGSPYFNDRISRGESYIPRLSISILGGIQPARLGQLHGLTSDGLLQRFLPFMMGPGTFPNDEPTAKPLGHYANLIRRLIIMPPAELMLDDDGGEVMTGLRRYLFDIEQVSGGLGIGFQAFVGKLPGVAGSLALILHLAANCTDVAPDPSLLGHLVGRDSVQAAARIIRDFVLPHAMEFYRSEGTVTDGDRIRRLAAFVLTAGKDRLVASDFTSNVWHLRGLSSFDVNRHISTLVAGGWLKPEGKNPIPSAWTVDAQVFKQLTERRQIEERRLAELAALMGSPRRAKGQ